ncbi:alpha-amylase [Halovibrio salipaludis]|uniref:Alpha-amylase n=1 Tax=Halovibrio salipaludis TaxID=2032626 RepID=A0A2A2F7C8_9GAMM|nr:alpha-amylase [Halovibrio salipaludis]PAU80495.1 alpha-amylase [Halovibrio salipaludis]
MFHRSLIAGACALGLSSLVPAFAHGPYTDGEWAGPRPDSHAPMGVMGDHRHSAGEWMISYRYMPMSMSDNQQGTSSISDDTIATAIPNRFAGNPMQPPTLRVVPRDMRTDMHMVGAMVAPTDRVTLMAMANYLKKEMTLTTYQGPTGTDTLGTFKTRNEGWGDIKLSALVGLASWTGHELHLNAGISLPTGSTDESDQVLTPMNTRQKMRLPYGMQLGSGTYDLLPGLTYNGHYGWISWGAQYSGVIRTGENDEGYTLGDEHEVTGWGALRVTPWLSTSLRLSALSREDIDGRDERIMAPVQTADPNNYGGERVDLGIGANLAGQSPALRGHRLGAELVSPIHQDVNGVQLGMDWMATLAYQYSW